MYIVQVRIISKYETEFYIYYKFVAGYVALHGNMAFVI